MKALGRSFSFAALAVCGFLVSAGCHAPADLPTPAHEQAKAEQHAADDTQREELGMIPPPSKSRFMAIHNLDSWENPYITVQANVLELHVLNADANPSQVGAGGMFRPTSARREELTISPDKLGDAVSAIPQSAWPYGRVMAIEEAHKTPKAMEPVIRRQMETTVGKLTDLGVVVYDPSEGTLR